MTTNKVLFAFKLRKCVEFKFGFIGNPLLSPTGLVDLFLRLNELTL